MCDAPTLSNVTHRRARVPHRCDECRRPIAQGEYYNDWRSLYEGQWSTTAYCFLCGIAWNILGPLLGDDGAEVGDLWGACVEAGAFERLPTPVCVDGASLLGSALGRLYGAAHEADDRAHALYRERVASPIADGRGDPSFALCLHLAHYAARRDRWRTP